jgi:UDPglucose 6-dehydrogenase
VRVTVVGLGYVGLVTAACLAQWGHRVTGIEVNPARVDALKSGKLPFFEPGLAELVEPNVRRGTLAFVPAEHDDSLSDADLVIVAVGTHDGNGGWQTATVQTCLARVVPLLRDDATLVIRSTLPPEYVRALGDEVNAFRDEVGRAPISVILNPEFTREGRAIRDFMEPDRVVIGVVTDPTGGGVERVRHVYRHALAPTLVMAAVDACLAKLGANLFLATKISFANELADLCEAFGATVDQVVEALSHDQRIGGAFLKSGVGFGGSCLPHQVAMTVRTAGAAGLPVPLLRAVDQINREQRISFVDRIRRQFGGSLLDRRIAILGLAFKPETDDLRDAPSLTIARLLVEAGANVVAYDPMPTARANAAELVHGLTVVDTATEAIAGADLVGVVTEWREFAELDWAAAGSSMRGRFIVDGRNALDPDRMRALGFIYEGYGRPSDEPVPDESDVAAVTDAIPAAGLPVPA